MGAQTSKETVNYNLQTEPGSTINIENGMGFNASQEIANSGTNPGGGFMSKIGSGVKTIVSLPGKAVSKVTETMDMASRVRHDDMQVAQAYNDVYSQAQNDHGAAGPVIMYPNPYEPSVSTDVLSRISNLAYYTAKKTGQVQVAADAVKSVLGTTMNSPMPMNQNTLGLATSSAYGMGPSVHGTISQNYNTASAIQPNVVIPGPNGQLPAQPVGMTEGSHYWAKTPGTNLTNPSLIHSDGLTQQQNLVKDHLPNDLATATAHHLRYQYDKQSVASASTMGPMNPVPIVTAANNAGTNSFIPTVWTKAQYLQIYGDPGLMATTTHVAFLFSHQNDVTHTTGLGYDVSKTYHYTQANLQFTINYDPNFNWYGGLPPGKNRIHTVTSNATSANPNVHNNWVITSHATAIGRAATTNPANGQLIYQPTQTFVATLPLSNVHSAVILEIEDPTATLTPFFLVDQCILFKSTPSVNDTSKRRFHLNGQTMDENAPFGQLMGEVVHDMDEHPTDVGHIWRKIGHALGHMWHIFVKWVNKNKSPDMLAIFDNFYCLAKLSGSVKEGEPVDPETKNQIRQAVHEILEGFQEWHKAGGPLARHFPDKIARAVFLKTSLTFFRSCVKNPAFEMYFKEIDALEEADEGDTRNDFALKLQKLTSHVANAAHKMNTTFVDAVSNGATLPTSATRTSNQAELVASPTSSNIVEVATTEVISTAAPAFSNVIDIPANARNDIKHAAILQGSNAVDHVEHKMEVTIGEKELNGEKIYW